ncbi:pentatricopeptide repeat-containing protein At3g57430, chloroplastic-like isoform X1 [Salvia miltiorrhiza]|uniref:pentatricopeptide repeat-containing protein At3g57430, chloroplastic-like isoform X1 n=1 Tax=Salvia miltiorrhiza TaxID=226208 RepID=UPI0025AC3FE1|nr:pentatricopeptide repeat-containing protein At3g57430, chloroplastic-like isoform X1 [Salvia miltiorrhiza]
MNCFHKHPTRFSWRQNAHFLLHLKLRLKYYSTQMSQASILQKIRDVKPLHQAHGHIIVSNLSENVFLCNRLMNAYASCGLVSKAQIIFSQIPNKNLVSWTILLSGLTKNGRFFEAVEVFYGMMVLQIRPNEITIASVLPAFGKLGRVLLGKSVHCYWIRCNFGDNVFVETGLIDMYSKFGCMRIARNVFDNMSVRNVVSWNAIISGYSDNGYGEEALRMFNLMKRKGMSGDIFTVMSLISLEDFRVGSGIHGLIVRSGYENDPLIRTALMGLYINGNFVNDAYRIFEEINKKDLVAWTSMLRGFSRSGNWRRTIEHFNKMMGENMIDYVSLITMLSGCSCSGALQQGRRMHALVLKTGFQDDLFVGSAVIDMYANCASMIDAKRYFGGMVERDAACWNALISGYGMIGCGNEAIVTFLKMKDSGLSPDESTLVSVLCACSHAGLVEQGLRIFDQMTKVWNLIPNLKHYACVVDLLGRSGRIYDAYLLTKRMHLQPGLEIYSSLLTACKIHRNFELGDEISRELIELKPNDAGHYILLSNMHALAGNWDCARMSRISLKSSNLKKNPGLSSMEINGEMFTFMASQTDHPHYLEIRDFLKGLILKIKAAGYEPDTDSVLLDVSDDVKRDILFHHSEKLAIAFGLMRTKPGAVVRITKNLRICDDCHLASKFVSKAYARVLVIKDAKRFHIFRDGVCSCRDWW